MATRVQKFDFAHRLMNNPNTKVSKGYLEAIRHAISDYSDLEDLNLSYVEWSSQDQIVFLKWKIYQTDLSLKQVNRLKKLGFEQCGNGMRRSGFRKDFVDDTKFWGFIQSLKTHIDINKCLYDDVIFTFLSKVAACNFLEERGGDRRLLNNTSQDDVRMIDSSLQLDGYLIHYAQEEFYNPSNYSDYMITFEKKKEEYIINVTGDMYATIVSEDPLTVCDILRYPQFTEIRVPVMKHYFEGLINNTLVYEDKNPPIDPLVLFNKAVDDLQEKDLSLNDLAKELILLSAKHLK